MTYDSEYPAEYGEPCYVCEIGIVLDLYEMGVWVGLACCNPACDSRWRASVYGGIPEPFEFAATVDRKGWER